MRAPISGICLGFRIIRGGSKNDADYGKLFIAQAADKDHDADLVSVYVQNLEIIDQLLKHYASGKLKWVDTYCNQVINGREMVWMCEKLFHNNLDPIEVEESA